MVKINRKMAEEMKDIEWSGNVLPAELLDLLRQGFCERDGCIFLVSLVSKETNASGSDFPDRTGHECFVNSIHIDDYVSSNYVANACIFVESVFQEWRRGALSGLLQAIVSHDEFGALVKFHLLRAGESWVGRELERYDDAMLVADSTEVMLH